MVLSVEANGYYLRWKVTLPLNCNFTGKQCNGQRKSRNVKPRGALRTEAIIRYCIDCAKFIRVRKGATRLNTKGLLWFCSVLRLYNNHFIDLLRPVDRTGSRALLRLMRCHDT